MHIQPTPLWTPSEVQIGQSNMNSFKRWLEANKNLKFECYDELWLWSITDLAAFWESVWQYFDIQYSGEYKTVLEKPADGMIGTRWFSGTQVCYAEHIFRNKNLQHPAVIFRSELKPAQSISWDELETKVAGFAAWLREQGITAGDRICAVLPNIPEALIAFLAVNSIGGIWSVCSPDFGNASIIDRFSQIRPCLLITADGYTYNGKRFDKTADMIALASSLPTVKTMVMVPFLNENLQVAGTVNWAEVIQGTDNKLQFTRLPFDAPLWILFSSGTTGKPKAITHSAGGCLLEHIKSISLHQDVKPGEKYFWYSTTGWMMWNYSVASMLSGATLVIYEGAAAWPDQYRLWTFAKETGVTHFGGGAAFYIACMKAGVTLGADDFPDLRTIGSTGSPLPSDAFQWIYEHVKKDVWLISLSGGTDIAGCFVGGNPLAPVYPGEIQCRLLGCALEALDESGKPVRDQLGEMVILEPMPSMPVYFWDDAENKKYFNSYFGYYPGIWRHGDWISITSRNTVIIFGRSDATLNRHGVRIGTSEIYNAVESLPEVADSIVVCIEDAQADFYMPLFVVLRNNISLDDSVKQKIRSNLRSRYSPRHVPDDIIQIEEVPYTLSGKKNGTSCEKNPDGAASTAGSQCRYHEKSQSTGTICKNSQEITCDHSFLFEAK